MTTKLEALTEKFQTAVLRTYFRISKERPQLARILLAMPKDCDPNLKHETIAVRHPELQMLWHPAFIERLTPEQLDEVIAHEMAHIEAMNERGML